ncbi:immunoglobulin superfamily DCC subclass member 3-like, partial [Heterodontus francisci]|uniref:immunoglobulin superfamily DCC subclass member 3-like n=1 Tax=Heterodontus francisci TaxID=7792 RepID=UPI00355B1903
PPEFVQWPQSVSKPAGSTAVFTCVAQGVPEPNLVWLKNGQVLTTPRENIKLTHSNSTLIINRITSSDEAIYQCIAKNSAGTNQASARLAVTLSQELPEPPEDVRAESVSHNAIRLTWRERALTVTEEIIGYVLHIRKAADSEGKEFQEAVSKTTFQHVFTNLEPDTAYSMYIKAYSPVGASRSSLLVTADTTGQVPDTVTFFTQVLNSSAVQVFWELTPSQGLIAGYKLYYRKVQSSQLVGPTLLSSAITSFTISHLEPSSLYEITMLAFNQHGDGNSTGRFVSLRDSTEKPGTSQQDRTCKCEKTTESPLSAIVVGIHIGMACIIFCILFLLLTYRRSLFGCKGIKESWSVPQAGHSMAQEQQNGHLEADTKDEAGRVMEMTEL